MGAEWGWHIKYAAKRYGTAGAIHETPAQVSRKSGPIVIGPYGFSTKPECPIVGAIARPRGV